MKPCLDPGLGSAGDEKLDPGNLFDESPQYGEDRGRRFLVSALIQSIDHYDRRKVRRLQWLDDQSFHLAAQ